MANCVEKLHHATQREALDHLRWAKRLPGGHGLRWLGVYCCPCGGGWCVGRSWKTKREIESAQPKPEKTISPGQQRRAEKRAAEKAAKQAMFADYQDTLRICRILVDRQIALYERLGIKPGTRG